MTPFCINAIRRLILRCKFDQRSATHIGDAVNKYHLQNCPGTHDFDEVMRTADFERFFSSPEHEVLMVSDCDQSMSVVNNLF